MLIPENDVKYKNTGVKSWCKLSTGFKFVVIHGLKYNL